MNNSGIINQPNNALLLSRFDYNNLPASDLPNPLDKLMDRVAEIFTDTIDKHLGDDENKTFIWTVKILNYPNSEGDFEKLTLGITELGMENGFDTNLTTHSRVDSQAQSFLKLQYKITVAAHPEPQ